MAGSIFHECDEIRVRLARGARVKLEIRRVEISTSRITRVRCFQSRFDGKVGETYCIGGCNARTNLAVVHAICAGQP
jgi:hypothetical protein